MIGRFGHDENDYDRFSYGGQTSRSNQPVYQNVLIYGIHSNAIHTQRKQYMSEYLRICRYTVYIFFNSVIKISKAFSLGMTSWQTDKLNVAIPYE
jgi:hypothetical protein